jgi:hypothetical protein
LCQIDDFSTKTLLRYNWVHLGFFQEFGLFVGLRHLEIAKFKLDVTSYIVPLPWDVSYCNCKGLNSVTCKLLGRKTPFFSSLSSYYQLVFSPCLSCLLADRPGSLLWHLGDFSGTSAKLVTLSCPI